MATEYDEQFRDVPANSPLDRGMFAAFAELVGDAGRVADVGSGPGRVTALLHELKLDVFGVDLSPAMVALARGLPPHLRFEEGSMLALDLPDGGLAGLVANYSVIHVPAERRPEVFAEFHRGLAPGGHVLVAFQAGDAVVHHTDGFGHEIDLKFHRLQPDDITGLLVEAGFEMTARLLREPQRDAAYESTPQAMLLARKPA